MSNQSDLFALAEHEELLDLVDENDQTIGVISRSMAHQNPIFRHREIGVLLINDQLGVLVQKRSRYKKVNPGMWSITAGHVVSGQTIPDTAHIELREELGFDTTLLRLTKVVHEYSWESHFMNYFLALYQGEKIRLAEAEVEEVKWVTEKDWPDFKKNNLVNLKHEPIFLNLWRGEYKSVLAELSSKIK